MSDYFVFDDSAQALKVDLEHEAVLVASGDLRLSANQTCWPAQELMEQKLAAAFGREGCTIVRATTFREGLVWPAFVV